MSHILFVAAEGLPFVKTGGLADVIGSLPHALYKEGYTVSVVMPLYLKVVKNQKQNLVKVASFLVRVGILNSVASIYGTQINGIQYYLIEHQGYYEREGFYGYPDDGERFAFFNHAVLRMIEEKVCEPDIIHSHDWHAGLISLLAKTFYKDRIKPALTIFTIHNLYFQGNYPRSLLGSCLGLPESYYDDGQLRFKDGISFLKAGIVYSDLVSTVSSTYAKEILTPEYGESMEEVLRLRQNDLFGIVNGIDTDVWNPETDSALAINYTTRNIRKAKAINKLAIQKELGLRQDAKVMLVAMVSRLTDQKGVWLLLQAMNDIMGWNIQLLILGTGDFYAESELHKIEYKYPQRAVFYCGYNEALAHRVYAGADILLMPSLFEPCGISQLIAMHYGTLPLVRETGGLKDTVEAYNQYTKKGTGFSFKAFNADDFKKILWLALDTYTNRIEDFNLMVKQAMKKDVSWNKSAKSYSKLFKKRIAN